MKKIAFVLMLFLFTGHGLVAQLRDVKLLLPKETGFSYYEFIEFMPDEKSFLVLANSLSVYDTETSEIIDEYALPYGGRNLSVSPDGSKILVSVNNQIFVFSFINQKLELKKKIVTKDLLKNETNGEIYSSVPVSVSFFVSDNIAYTCIGSFSFAYDVNTLEVKSHHTFKLGEYVVHGGYDKQRNSCLLALISGTNNSIVRQSVQDLTDVSPVIQNIGSASKIRLRDNKLMCFTGDKYFVMDIPSGEIQLEIRVPKVKQNALFKIEDKYLKEINRRPSLSKPDTLNFKPDEYIYDMDLLAGSNELYLATSTCIMKYDLVTKKAFRFPDKYIYNLKFSRNGQRLIGNSLALPKGLRVFEPKEMRLISERIAMTTPIYSAKMSPNNRWLSTNCGNANVIWDLNNFTKYAEIKDPSKRDSSFVSNVFFLNDTELVVNSGVTINKMNLSVYNLRQKKYTKQLKKGAYAYASGFHNGEFYYADYGNLHIINLQTMKEEKYSGLYTLAATPQYKVIEYTEHLVFVPEAGKFKIIDRVSKKEVYKGESWSPNANVSIAPDEKSVITSSQIKTKKNINGYDVEIPVNAIVKIDLTSGEVKTHYAETYFPYDVSVNRNENTIRMWYVKQEFGKSNDSLKETVYTIYDYETGNEKESYVLDKTENILTEHSKSANGKYFALDNATGSYLKVFDSKGQLVMDLSSLEISIPRLFFNEENDVLIITSSVNSMAFFVDLKAKRIMGQLANAEADQYFLLTPDMYYMGSKEFVKSIRFKYNSEIFSFEQFDAFLNQPHRVLREFKCKDSAMIEGFESAYNKRMRLLKMKSGVLPALSKLPSFQYVKMRPDPKENAVFNISARKGVMDLKEFSVFNNGNLIYNKELKDSEKEKLNLDLKFETSSGINRFEFILKDVSGIESPRITRYFNNTKQIKPNLYMVVIASEKFKNNKFDLAYAIKDATDMANTMSNSKSFENIYIKKVFNQSFSNDSLFSIKSFLSKSNVNDVVMVFFAGHGYLDDDMSYYFPTYYTDFTDPKINSVPFESFQSMFGELKSLRKLMFIDACFSGEVDEEDFYEDEGEQPEKSERSGTSYNFKQSTALEISKSIFSDLRQNSGVTIISSAGGTEAAFEGEKWNNGLFTHCVLEALTDKKADKNGDKKIMLSELQKYVADAVYELSDGKQSPTYRMENTAIDYELWSY